MYSNSLGKALNSILNTLPRTLAPLEAIRIWKQFKQRIKDFFKKTVKLQKSRSVCYDFTKKNLVAQFLTRKMTRNRVNESSENWQCDNREKDACENFRRLYFYLCEHYV